MARQVSSQVEGPGTGVYEGIDPGTDQLMYQAACGLCSWSGSWQREAARARTELDEHACQALEAAA